MEGTALPPAALPAAPATDAASQLPTMSADTPSTTTDPSLAASSTPIGMTDQLVPIYSTRAVAGVGIANGEKYAPMPTTLEQVASPDQGPNYRVMDRVPAAYAQERQEFPDAP
jgi:hypothetical protein